jgi:hypothetical protein
MRPIQRLVSAAVLLSLCCVLTGCGSMTSWDPSDMLDFLDTKKKLPGDRKPVFPEGVPGLEQGVPKDLYKDNVEREQRQEQAAESAAAAPPPAAPAPTSRARPKTRAKVNVGTVRSADPDAAPAEDGSTAAAPPAPKPKKIVRRRTTTPPADDQSAAPATAAPAPASPAGQSSGSAFPAPMPSGTFSR